MRPSSTLTSTVVLLLVAAGRLHALEQEGQELKAANPHGRQYPPRVYQTVRLQAGPPRIDGHLDDEAWREGAWAGAPALVLDVMHRGVAGLYA